MPYSPECVEEEVSEVSERFCDGELATGTGAFYGLLQIPHNPLRPFKGHRVACIGVNLEPRIGDRPRAPLLLLAPKDGVPLSPEDQRGRLYLTKAGRVVDRIDVHRYGEAILYGWGDDQEQITNPNMNFQNAAFNSQRGIANDAAYREYTDPPDQTLTIDLANRMRDAIRAVRERAYKVKTSFDPYPTAGTSTDYADSRQFADASKGKMYSYTIEWGREFQPPYSEMRNIIREVTAGFLDFCLATIELTQTSTPRTM
jgi:hypothetical protein